MSTGVQPSLFDAPTGAADLAPLPGHLVRHSLSDGAWVDVRPGWITGSIPLFNALMADVPWRAERRQMYDAVIDVPRLLAFYERTQPLPADVLVRARNALSHHYRRLQPDGFATAGLALYRDGSDSVAWHGDRIGRGDTEDTLIAIVSLGSPRCLMLRPRGGGASRRFVLGSGDLLVMGGTCQRTWDHAVPKTTGVGPRISVQFRPPGVR
ncbi:MAG: alpha-ketoglutarate-dependent dioxygenase AlkB [Gordonia sp. (in: high G+C Gram-positive bacteria)]|uniref:alpha-ketoglutarate-dependent dioxygenase AlkB n=1 Tax=Gordonia sp. (in: high G+C Gram-positive bacteria) TaxID=84139 RepID=UPI003C751D92